MRDTSQKIFKLMNHNHSLRIRILLIQMVLIVKIMINNTNLKIQETFPQITQIQVFN